MRPSRILMTTDAVGGVWQYSLDLAQELAAAGTPVLLVGLGPEPTPPQREAVAALPGIELVWLNEPLDWLVEDETALDPLGPRLDHLAERHAVDLLHLNTPSQAVGLQTSRPVVVASHSCVVTWWQAMRSEPLPAEWEWQRRRNLAGFRRADAVLAPSRSHAEALLEAYGTIAGLKVVPNAVRPVQVPTADKEPFVLAAGRWWDEGKNAALLDSAAVGCRWPLLMAGSLGGPNGQMVTPLHAQTAGVVSAFETRALMARASIFVAPSLYEPFGLAPLEAALAGCALVVTDIPIFHEIWDDAAVFVDPHDPEELRQVLDRLAEEPAERRELARLAAARASEFSPARQVEALSRIYADVLSNGGRAPAAAEL
ncbi:glycosyltransferase family 4 protein [Aurantimonas sp. MSK8Z-1]|uniref:glycosyltransferase family 4 protein n=1 Tax=Mangrovibrevibacter kandeliae TaxID=2968473 RepID=UPI00211801C6|nr:glycosyltransferase family 4 protein [Aurantimonas sp. MSK8Z-1]MCW4115830.1 glycosyltransferase family 4 protein [Aurantimonas sp. MSK8Z-1]